MQAMNVGLVLLGAGGASRMGVAKQLLEYRGRTLIRHAAVTGLEAGFSPVVLVLGARAEEMRREVSQLAVEVAVNAEWERGIGSSIRAGMKRSRELSGAMQGCVIGLCDQPRVTAALLRSLVEEHLRSRKPIVATEYGQPPSPGVPAYFSNAFFEALESLPDPAGAKKLILENRNRTVVVATELPTLDVDTPEDYRRLSEMGE